MTAADSGHSTQLRGGSQVVILNQGTRSGGTALLRDFRITDLQDYQAIVGHQVVAFDLNDTGQMDVRTSWNTDTDRAHTELDWCITLIFTMFMMVLMVTPLSMVNPRQGRILSMLPAMLLYLLLLLIQTPLKSNGGKGKLDPTLRMWTISLIYLALAIVLNLRDVVPARRLRASFSHKGTVRYNLLVYLAVISVKLLSPPS